MLISDIPYSTLRAVLAYKFERINILQGGCQGADLDRKVTVTQWQRSKQALLIILGIDHVIGH